MINFLTNKRCGFALILVLILVVVAGVLGVTYVVSSGVQAVGASNLLLVTQARYVAESGLEHATYRLRTDPDASAELGAGYMGPYELYPNTAGDQDSYMFTAADQGSNIYIVSGAGTTGPISQPSRMTLKLTSHYTSVMHSLGPLSLWRLGDAGSNANDSESTSDGTHHGVSLGQVGAIVADPSTCGYFSRNDYVEIPHSDDFLLDDGTVFLWFRVSGRVRDYGLFSKDSRNRDTGGHLTISTDRRLRVSVSLESTARTYRVRGGSLESDKWHCAAFTFGSEGMKLYVDGLLVDTDSYTGGLGTTSGGIGNYEPIAIGAQTTRSGNLVVTPLRRYFTGKIDETAVFDKALTQSQVIQLYNSRVAEATIISWDR